MVVVSYIYRNEEYTSCVWSCLTLNSISLIQLGSWYESNIRILLVYLFISILIVFPSVEDIGNES